MLPKGLDSNFGVPLATPGPRGETAPPQAAPLAVPP